MSEKSEPSFPECDKWSKVYKDAAIIREFLDWASRNHELNLWRVDEHERAWPPYECKQTLIEKFFDIDGRLMEKERRQLLEMAREAQQKR